MLHRSPVNFGVRERRMLSDCLEFRPECQNSISNADVQRLFP